MIRLDNYRDVLSTNDVREILGVGANTVYNLLTSGAIKSFKIGRVRKIPKDCLLQYINSAVAIHNINKEYNNDSDAKDQE